MKDQPRFQRISIMGLGLLGGSLAAVIKEKNLADEVIAYTRTPSTLAYAIEEGIIDKAATTMADAVIDTDLIIICTPLSAYRSIAEGIRPFLKPGVIIIDVGSVKSCAIEAVLPILSESEQPYFVPCHPIAGSEKSGIKATNPELYAEKKVIITPLPQTNPKAIKSVTEFWEAIGSKVITMEADAHDRLYAQLSHVVQAVAYAYMNKFRIKAKLVDPNFRRFCRLSGSDPRMWRDIFIYNSPYVCKEINELIKTIRTIDEAIKATSHGDQDIQVKAWLDKNNVLFDKRDRIDPISLISTVNLTIDLTRHVVPCLIALALVECCSDILSVGSGFKDVTSILSLWPFIGFQVLQMQAAEISKLLNGFIDELSLLSHLMSENKQDELEQYCVDSVLRYHSIFG